MNRSLCLIADPDPATAEALSFFTKELWPGWLCVHTTNMRLVPGLLRRVKPQLLLLDNTPRMPEEVAEAIQAAREQGVRCILMSTRPLCQTPAGVERVLKKPFDMPELMALAR